MSKPEPCRAAMPDAAACCAAVPRCWARPPCPAPLQRRPRRASGRLPICWRRCALSSPPSSPVSAGRHRSPGTGRSGGGGTTSAPQTSSSRARAAGADDCGAAGHSLGRVGDAALAGGPAEGAQRHDAAGRACRARRRERSQRAAVLLGPLRHTLGDRRVGLPPGRSSSEPIDCRARRAHRVGDAVLVLGQSQPGRVRSARGPQYAGPGGSAGAAPGRRPASGAAGARPPLGSGAYQHSVLRRPRDGERAQDRRRGSRPRPGAARPALATRPTRSSTLARRWPRPSRRASGPATGMACTSRGTAPTRRRGPSATA
jgi:hypothetical protein